MKYINILLMILIAIPSAQAIGTIVSLDFKSPEIIADIDKQVISVTLTKPLVNQPTDMQVVLSINGTAYFKNGRKTLNLDFSEINWSDGFIKQITKDIELTAPYANENAKETVTITSNLTYYNEVFGYKKVNKSSEINSASYSIVWRDDATDHIEQLVDIEGNFDKLKTEYGALETKFDTLMLENDELNKKNSQLMIENEKLTNENSDLKLNSLKYNIYKYASIILIIISLILFFKKR